MADVLCAAHFKHFIQVVTCSNHTITTAAYFKIGPGHLSALDNSALIHGNS